jgi:hypothetical protein
MTTGAPPLGRRLLDLGWRQGAFLTARGTRYAWLRRDAGGAEAPKDWSIASQEGHPDEWWVVASQDCDIAAKAEPRVELLRASWTKDKGAIREARRNSVRKFLLRTRQLPDGKQEGLIADALIRVHVEKEALLELTPGAELPRLDASTLDRFKVWLARRYDRPAVPDPIVDAIQKPLVEAIRSLPDDDPVSPLLGQLDEIRFHTPDAVAPFRVSLLFIHTKGEPLKPTDEAELIGWMEQVLTGNGKVHIEATNFRDLGSIDVASYLGMTRLTLDEFSLGTDEA